MYQLLLCWRYLRTRYIALASIVSVTLGVATMIVVNSVMSGFTTEMQDRMHGVLSDVVVAARNRLKGFPDAQWHMDRIRQAAGGGIEGMTPTVVVHGMLSFQNGDDWINQHVQLIGVDPNTLGQVTELGNFLQHPANREGPVSFTLPAGGFDTRDHQAGLDAPERSLMAVAGWEHRRWVAARRRARQTTSGARRQDSAAPPPVASPSSDGAGQGPPPDDPWAGAESPAAGEFDMATRQHPGAILGFAMAAQREKNPQTGQYEDCFYLMPGDDVVLTFPNCTAPPKGMWYEFTVVDLLETKMSEYDSTFVLVDIQTLQHMRWMYDETSGAACVNAIQIKLKPGVDGTEIRDRIQEAFPSEMYEVSTWRDKQGPLLAAVEMETAILNVLLFLIIAVAGFGILAIFLMIVVEKTRDIGILKSLGASGWGIQKIFLMYGFSLGLVGSAVGTILGLLFVRYINQIADLLSLLTGKPVFDPEVYYFYKIPAIVNPWTVAWIVFGAVAIAVLASILPAFRAARLHPVEALRYE
ncbi:MAG: ABC transporter permease [Planctomycetota bacterium]|jgi:lipoprotein-releasing system permease protein